MIIFPVRNRSTNGSTYFYLSGSPPSDITYSTCKCFSLATSLLPFGGAICTWCWHAPSPRFPSYGIHIKCAFTDQKKIKIKSNKKSPSSSTSPLPQCYTQLPAPTCHSRFRTHGHAPSPRFSSYGILGVNPRTTQKAEFSDACVVLLVLLHQHFAQPIGLVRLLISIHSTVAGTRR